MRRVVTREYFREMLLLRIDGCGISEPGELVGMEGPFRGVEDVVVGGSVPGGKGGIAGIAEDVDVLGGHITLCQEEGFVAVFIHGDIEDDHGMAWGASFDEDVAGPDLLYIGDASEIAGEGLGAGEAEDGLQVGLKRGPVVGRGGRQYFGEAVVM